MGLRVYRVQGLDWRVLRFGISGLWLKPYKGQKRILQRHRFLKFFLS